MARITYSEDTEHENTWYIDDETGTFDGAMVEGTEAEAQHEAEAMANEVEEETGTRPAVVRE